MRKYAVLNNNVVIEIINLTEDDCQKYMHLNQILIDIGDLLIQPQIGWVISGNKLVPPASQAINIREIIKSKIKSFQDQAPELLRELYVENTLLGITIEQSKLMFEDYRDVLICIREGAWPTAIYCLQQKVPQGFVTYELHSKWITLIQAKINS